MYFKPRIFISSTLDLKEIRTEIKELFDSLGAETLIYEKNLTPSVQASTYRKDIENADFVIFILQDKYGTKTETGKSGTHEEWEITSRLKIPKHVYIQNNSKSKKSKDLNQFIKEKVEGNMTSFFYYDSKTKLLDRIKETMFIISKEIALHNIEKDKLPESKVKKIALDYDFAIAIKIIKDVESIRQLCNKLEWDYQYIDTFTFLYDLWHGYKVNKRNLFIDGNLDLLFEEMLIKLHLYTEEHATVSCIGKYAGSIYFEILEESVNFHRVTFNQSYDDYDKLESLLSNFFNSYDKFREYMFIKKNDLDIKY
ncbi:MAG: hypothetical protein K0S61_557 [Anaerocolumna sp.]|jgi:hypothetical protein|nr:hypothetical protein [Anaerocolumna sp.]